MQVYAVTSVSPELTDRLRAMPKAEIHVHVEGATDAETFYQMAQRNRVDLPIHHQRSSLVVEFR